MALQEEFEKRGNWLFRYRGTIPLLILVPGLALFLWRKIHPEPFFPGNQTFETYYEYACLLVSLFGLFIRVYTVGHTPHNTSGGNVKSQLASVLNTTGSYSVVRHPLYVGNFFMWLGPALLTGHLWFILVFCLAYWLYYERIMFAEEQFLRRKFGDPYLEWSKHAPAFVPAFRNFRKPEMPFSWRKVVRKEKNGLAAVFLIFFVFNVMGELVAGERDFNLVFAAGFLLSVINYIIAKLLIKRTRLLESRNS
ncbi:MAG: isoprenylcysteine carboxylmethyltransferase family protein [Bacteroidota bacterium]